MAGWFTTKCPVDAQQKTWIEHRMNWLCSQFGLEKLKNVQVILPTKEFFPDPFDGSEASFRRLLDRVCGYMGVDTQRIDMQLYADQHHDKVAPGIYVTSEGKGALGTYQKGMRHMISIEVSTRADPLSMIATMAHELAHVHLLGDDRITHNEQDHEPLTDLTTVFLGLGVFTANSVVRESRWSADGWSGWRIGQQGYLSEPMYGYAFALFAWVRGETKPLWESHLRLNVRSALRNSLRYLQKTNDSTFRPS